MSRRQLHEAERVLGPGDAAAMWPSVRSCGMEALDAAQHRTQVKPRKADRVGVSARRRVTPDIQSGPIGSEDGCGVKLCTLTQGDLLRSTPSGRAVGGNDDRPMPAEKSDHPVVVKKPGNADGAKGVMG